MNLKEVLIWAKNINTLLVPEKSRYKAKCYIDMILEKGNAVDALTDKINRYVNDIQEYLANLEKVGLVLPKPELPNIEPVEKERKKSPLIPEEEPKNEHVQEGGKKPAQSEKIL